jgi:hypothetical protein
VAVVAEDELVEVDLPGAGARRRSGCLQSDNQQPCDRPTGSRLSPRAIRPHLIEQLEVALEASRPRSAGFAAEVVGRRGPVGADLAGTETAPERAVGDKPMPSSRTVGSTSWPTSTPTTRAVVALDVAHRHAARRPLPSRGSNGSAEGRMGQGPRLIAGENGHANAWRTLSRAGDCAAAVPAARAAAPLEWPCPGDLRHIDSKRFARFTRTVTPSPVISTAAAARSGCGSAPELARSVVDDHPRLPTASSTATRRPRPRPPRWQRRWNRAVRARSRARATRPESIAGPSTPGAGTHYSIGARLVSSRITSGRRRPQAN